MFNLFKKHRLVWMPQDFSKPSKSSITIKQTQELRNNILNKNLGSYNSLAQSQLCDLIDWPVNYQKLDIKAYDQSLSKQYQGILAVDDQKARQGAQILIARHLRLSRDVLASQATRLQKIQSGFKTLAAQVNNRSTKFK